MPPAFTLSEPVRAARRRWTLSLVAVLAAHASFALGVVEWTPDAKSLPPPPAPIMLELAPVPQAPPQPPSEMPPRPKQIQSKAKPPEPAPPPEKPDPAPQTEAEVALPEPEPLPPPPEPDPEPRADVPSAPSSVQAQPSDRLASARETWQGALLAHLERHRRYPYSAQRRRQEGVSYLRFSMNRQGAVVSAMLERTSGHEVLDAEVMALIERAQPLPPPPDEVAGDPIELIVPVEFFLRRR